MQKYGQHCSVKIETLSVGNEVYVNQFSCGNKTIDDYFRSKAARDQTAVTYMFIDEENDCLIACATIACSAIFTEDENEKQFSTILSAMEIKYLAVDERYQHMPYFPEKKSPTLSDMMFDYMLDYMEKMSHQKIGASKIVLYSVPKAVSFYKRHGFVEFGDMMYGDQGYFVDGCKPMYFDLND